MTGEVARFARLLATRARSLASLARSPREVGALIDGALDPFLADPRPSTFVAAMRVLGEERRRLLSQRPAAARPREAPPPPVSAGVDGLRRTAALPASVTGRLAGLPPDRRARQRLLALSALVRAYEELAARVAADTEEMRRQFRDAALGRLRARARPRPPEPGPRRGKRARPPS